MIYKLSRYILIKQQAKAKLYITVKNDEKLRKVIFARSYQIQALIHKKKIKKTRQTLRF